MTRLPTKQRDKFADVDVRNFSSAGEMNRRQLLLMDAISESRGDFEAASFWKEQAMLDAAREFENKTVAESTGTPLVEQAPAPAVPSLNPSTEFQRKPSTSSAVTDRALAVEARRNEKLLANQVKSMQ